MALISQMRNQGTESSNNLPKVTQPAHSKARSRLAGAHALYLWAALPLGTFLTRLSNPTGKLSKKYKRTLQHFPLRLHILGSVKLNCVGASAEERAGEGEGEGEGVGQALTHRGWWQGSLVEERLENHCEGRLLVVLAGGQELFPGFLKKGVPARLSLPHPHTRGFPAAPRSESPTHTILNHMLLGSSLSSHTSGPFD